MCVIVKKKTIPNAPLPKLLAAPPIPVTPRLMPPKVPEPTPPTKAAALLTA